MNTKKKITFSYFTYTFLESVIFSIAIKISYLGMHVTKDTLGEKITMLY